MLIGLMRVAEVGVDLVGMTIESDLRSGVSYRIERWLGQGGTAAAYLATRHCDQGQSPAVMKIILPEVAMDPDGTAAKVVKKEAVALGRLNERVPPTPFVVRFMDVGTVNAGTPAGTISLPWLAVEYVHGGVEGTTLEDRVAFSVQHTGFAFDAERASRVLSHVGQGLSEVHAAGVVHRDLTPNNVLCCGFAGDEMFKISDFGIARPRGLDATFGSALVGTPGYIAPELALDGASEPAPVSDIFSFAAIGYFVLTGEPYFDTRNPVQAVFLARREERRSILEAARLCPELRCDESTCRAIDEALARATAGDPRLRPANARAFAASLVPLLSTGGPPRRSRRHVSSVLEVQSVVPTTGWAWTVRHPPGDDRIVNSVGWDGDGHCLAATNRGLSYWNGSEWLPVPGECAGLPEHVCFVRRIESGRWLLAADRARLVEYSRDGVTRVVRGPDRELTFTLVGGDIDDLAVVVALRAGWPPLLCACVGGHWLKPLPVPAAAAITSITEVEETRWLLAGRSTEGKGFAALYAPLDWQLEAVPAPETRALVACAGLSERRVGVAVGGQGAVLRVRDGRVRAHCLNPPENLASAAVDLLDRTWAGGAGQLWLSSAGGDGWVQVWRDDDWQAPFISILADAGLVVAMTADGGVLECRASLSQITVPPPTVV